jgi:hypothetical protein
MGPIVGLGCATIGQNIRKTRGWALSEPRAVGVVVILLISESAKTELAVDSRRLVVVRGNNPNIDLHTQNVLILGQVCVCPRGHANVNA